MGKRREEKEEIERERREEEIGRGRKVVRENWRGERERSEEKGEVEEGRRGVGRRK